MRMKRFCRLCKFAEVLELGLNPNPCSFHYTILPIANILSFSKIIQQATATVKGLRNTDMFLRSDWFSYARKER